MKRLAIGYLSRRTSGKQCEADEHELQIDASVLGWGYELTMIVYARYDIQDSDPQERETVDDDPDMTRLPSLIASEGADIVFVPSATHLCDGDIEVLTRFADVYFVDTGDWHTIYPENDDEPEGTPRVKTRSDGPDVVAIDGSAGRP